MRHCFQRFGRRIRTGHKPQASGRRLAMVDVLATLDGDVFHRQRSRPALLHCAVFTARLRELHSWRRHPAVTARNLERRGLPGVPRGTSFRSSARCVCKLRPAVELVTGMTQAAIDSAPAAPRQCVVALAIPTLNEEASIGDVLRAVPSGVVARIIVADGGSTDATAARARGAGAEVIDAGCGYGRACLAAAMAAEDADIVVFMDGDGADDPAFVA